MVHYRLNRLNLLANDVSFYILTSSIANRITFNVLTIWLTTVFIINGITGRSVFLSVSIVTNFIFPPKSIFDASFTLFYNLMRWLSHLSMSAPFSLSHLYLTIIFFFPISTFTFIYSTFLTPAWYFTVQLSICSFDISFSLSIITVDLLHCLHRAYMICRSLLRISCLPWSVDWILSASSDSLGSQCGWKFVPNLSFLFSTPQQVIFACPLASAPSPPLYTTPTSFKRHPN